MEFKQGAEEKDELLEAIQAYRHEVERLRAIGLNQYGEAPAVARQEPTELRDLPAQAQRTINFQFERAEKAEAENERLRAELSEAQEVAMKWTERFKNSSREMEQHIHRLEFLGGIYDHNDIVERAGMIRATLKRLQGEKS